MKITDIDIFIKEFRNGRDIWSRTAIELAVREIERLKQRVAIQEDLLRLAEGDKQTISEVLTNTIARRDERIKELEEWQRKATVWSGNAIIDIEKLGKAEKRIKELEQEKERLREALREIADTSSKYKLEGNEDGNNNYWEWEDNALDLLNEIDKIVEKALNEVTK